jgi:hypothetical protein
MREINYVCTLRKGLVELKSLYMGRDKTCRFLLKLETCFLMMILSAAIFYCQVRVWRIGSQSHNMIASMKAHVAAVSAIAVRALSLSLLLHMAFQNLKCAFGIMERQIKSFLMGVGASRCAKTTRSVSAAALMAPV